VALALPFHRQRGPRHGGGTVFLFHHENGKYAPGYKQFLAQGAKPEDFELLFGPVERVQEEWYRYLLELQLLH
jgi:hypothetical protein